MGLLGCIYRSGKKSVFYTALVGFGFFAGTKAADDTRYKIHRIGNDVYLVDKATSQKEPITDDFQLGSIEYRLNSLLEKKKNSLENITVR